MKLIDDFQISFENTDILQLLSGNKQKTKNKQPNPALLQELEKLKIEARKIIHPKAVYDIFPSTSLYPKFLFAESDFTVLAICTIGRELEKASEKALEKGQLSKGVILDAIASSVAEDIASQLYHLILKERTLNKPNLQFTKRFSPGYCQWTLEKGQDMIFEKLPNDEINVTLTKTKLMIPRKSISFAVNFGTKVDQTLGTRECSTCEISDCEYRR